MPRSFTEWMEVFSKPRPNGSRALEQTFTAISEYLRYVGMEHEIHSFRLYDQFFTWIGIWLICSRSLLAVALWMHWGWWVLWIAFIGLIGGLVDVGFNVPTITRLKSSLGKNILIKFAPPTPVQEIIISAHYDSKTELLDHHQRMFFLKNLPLGIALTIFCGLWGVLDGWLNHSGSSWAGGVYVIGIIANLPLLILAWGLGLNLSLGCLRPPSQGAVDNGAACAILLKLAERLHTQGFPLLNTHLTIALFCGEEVNMQGSRAYVHQREWKAPAAALNLEVMAQDGDYVYWEKDGNSLRQLPTSAWLNASIASSIQVVHGKPPRPRPVINSDGSSFLFAGLPCTTIGTLDRHLVDRGFHHASDNLQRVKLERLEEGVDLLHHFLMQIDAEKTIYHQTIKPGGSA